MADGCCWGCLARLSPNDPKSPKPSKAPAKPGCATQGKTIEELERNIIETIELCIEDDDRPEGESQFVGIRRVDVAASSGCVVDRSTSALKSSFHSSRERLR